MKKLAILILSLAFVMPVFAKPVSFNDIPFVTMATTQNGEKMIVHGTLKGIATPPTFGFYVAEITNAASFKKKYFSVMNCTVHKNPKSIHIRNPVEIKTVYKTDYGFEEVTGVMEAIKARPIDGYIVNIKNGKKVQEWVNLKCKIK